MVSVLDTLQQSLAAVFDQTQLTIANHRKNCVSLYKIHLQASSVTHKGKTGSTVKLVGERHFGDIFIDMINRVLVVKKGPPIADRTVKFIGEYVKFINEKGAPASDAPVNLRPIIPSQHRNTKPSSIRTQAMTSLTKLTIPLPLALSHVFLLGSFKDSLPRIRPCVSALSTLYLK